MEHEHAAPQGAVKSQYSELREAVTMGTGEGRIEVWQPPQSDGAITAVWRNEVGPSALTEDSQ